MPGLGRLESKDPRNANFPMRATLQVVPADLPTLKTWEFWGAPLDQGETGTCTAHAAAHAIHASPVAYRKHIDPFSLYREIVLLDEYAENDSEAQLENDKLQMGSSGTGAAKALLKRGLISEFRWADNLQTAIACVLTRGGVLFGTNWYSSMFTPTAEGFVKITPSATIVGGHEWFWRGIDMRRGLGEAVNSWGPRWNRKPTGRWSNALLRSGHFLFELELAERLFKEGGDIVSLTEKRLA